VTQSGHSISARIRRRLKLNLKKSALLAEICSAVAVVASLIFVGFQVRQSNYLAESEAIINLGQSMNELQISVAGDVALSELLAKAYESQEDLNVSETYRLDAWVLGWLNIYDSSWMAYDRGIIQLTAYQEYMDGACRFISEASFVQEAWARYKIDFGKGFVQYIDTTCNPP
jgi:hypothetical protein